VEPVAVGLPASPGAAAGKCVFDADLAEKLGKTGEKVILVREETRPEDIHGFFAAEGILTSRGGKTSHAAVVARGMGKPCVAGAEGITVNVKMRLAYVGEKIIHEGDVITLDGATGNVYLGAIPTLEAHFSDDLKTLLSWADEASKLKVMANADTPDAARRAREYGYRIVPDGANVQCQRPPADRHRHDTRQYHGRQRGCIAVAAADPTCGFHRIVHRNVAGPGDGAIAGSADARVPADRTAVA
jgi:phosphoenolpyruvate synthase/pyruvate phosphate dikinase